MSMFSSFIDGLTESVVDSFSTISSNSTLEPSFGFSSSPLLALELSPTIKVLSSATSSSSPSLG
ncbi:hypothetical protein Lalb_Chr03g0043381 [Lupinus albus]|uniref:Uncharacterized protein n=1 Tax=Lupinus albus TaxID=3870 RepID=A0A6A4QY90_LUPAL|nr:hypothetical protein Lalb_Chr03g0043381 [Lupinus albus]